MPAWYATVEDVSRVLGVKSTAYADDAIRRAVAAGSADVDNILRWSSGSFRPSRKTIYREWPSRQTTDFYRLWLDGNPLLSVETLTTGGTTIDPAKFFLEPQEYGPPYNRIELNRGSSVSFSYTGATPQRAVAITGLWGLGDDRAPAGTLVGTINASVTSITCSDGSAFGIGDHFVIDSERLEVTGRSWTAAGTVDTGGLASSAAANTLPLAGGSVSAGELLLVEAERMLVVDVSGSTVTVRRAVDGTTLAAHSAAAAVYARRGLMVTRGAQGSTAASHTTGAALSRHVVPGDVSALCIASAITVHLHESTAYAQDKGAEGAQAKIGEGISTLRDRVSSNYGRQSRMRVV